MTKSRNISSSPDTININLKNPSSSNDEMSNSDTTSYLIGMNRKLLREKEELVVKNTELECTIESNEDDMGRTENANRHLKGVLNNFNIRSELYQNTSANWKLICLEYENDMKELNENLVFIRNLCVVSTSIFLSIIFMYYDLSTFIFSCITTINPIIFIQISTNFKLNKQKKIREQISIYQKEIKEIEKSLDFVSEYINAI
jgi:hypothetical protein|tara:strand:- start:502 stop:1107 length:606 start_codon:yes stop_codon:yes gene_type:complete